MGRKRGFLALHVGIAVGAEVILIPEKSYLNITHYLEKCNDNISKRHKCVNRIVLDFVGR